MIAVTNIQSAVALVGELRKAGATGLADRLDAFGNGTAAHALRQSAEHVNRLLAAMGRKDPAAAADALRQWMPDLIAHTASAAIDALSDQAGALLQSREMADALGTARRPALEAARSLEQVAALKPRADGMRRFETSASRLTVRGAGDWESVSADLLKRLRVL